MSHKPQRPAVPPGAAPSRPGKESPMRKAMPMAVPMRPGAGPSTQAKPGAPAQPQRAHVLPASAAAAASQAAEVPEEDVEQNESWEAFKAWAQDAGGPYMASMLFHAALFLVLFLVLGATIAVKKISEIAFEAVEPPPVPEEVEEQEIKIPPPLEEFKKADVETSSLDTEKNLVKGELDSKLKDGAPETVEAKTFDDNPVFQDEGGGTAGDIPESLGTSLGYQNENRDGPAKKGAPGTGSGGGLGTDPGLGGKGTGLGGRGQGSRAAMAARHGGTRGTERAVNNALDWLKRHQNINGSWSIHDFKARCSSGACSGAGSEHSDSGATAMALLPYLGAGVTHQTKSQYQKTVFDGLNWLLKNQKADGDLSAGSHHRMYSHGLATIALCEAYALSKDSRIGHSAQQAIAFIQNAQDKTGGGWRYQPGQAGDTSVVGWQVMALKSGQMGDLKVSPQTFDGARKYLAMAGGGEYGWQFGYTGPGATPAMVGVGLLCRQYLGASKDDPGMVEGRKYLMANLPNPRDYRNTYYWYYATQVMHNLQGKDWEQWNLAMRTILVDTQQLQGCQRGSWDPDKPAPDHWGRQGGRLMMTSLSCLTLEIYYRYLPLYDLEKKGAVKKGAGPNDVEVEEREIKDKKDLM